MINVLSIAIGVLVVSLCITAAIAVVQGLMNNKANKIFLFNALALLIIGILKEIHFGSLLHSFSLIEFLNTPGSVFVILGWLFIIVLVIGTFKGGKK